MYASRHEINRFENLSTFSAVVACVQVSQEISDPEARAVAVHAHAMLVKVAGSEDGAAALEAEAARRAKPIVRTCFIPSDASLFLPFCHEMMALADVLISPWHVSSAHWPHCHWHAPRC